MADDPNKPFSFTSQQEATEFIGNVVSTLLKADRKATKKEILDDISKQLETFGTNLNGRFQELGLKLESKRDKKPRQEGQTGDEDAPPAPDPHLRTLQKKVEELETIAKTERERASTAENKRRLMTVQGRLREVLEANGVTNPHKVKGAMAILINQERKVDFSEAFDDAAFIDTDDAPIDLEQGVRTWLSTDEGEYYRDPSGAAGAGTRPGRKGAKEEARPLTKAELGMALLNSWNGKGG